jgi:hypothetical protein
MKFEDIKKLEQLPDQLIEIVKKELKEKFDMITQSSQSKKIIYTDWDINDIKTKEKTIVISFWATNRQYGKWPKDWDDLEVDKPVLSIEIEIDKETLNILNINFLYEKNNYY